jgi:hypothetical protein
VHATFRRIKTKPGMAAEVGRLIKSGYLPLMADVSGFVSYTLVDLGDDEVSSIGIFTSAESAEQANELARSWTAQTLGRYVDSPLEARAGSVLVSYSVRQTGD